MFTNLCILFTVFENIRNMKSFLSEFFQTIFIEKKYLNFNETNRILKNNNKITKWKSNQFVMKKNPFKKRVKFLSHI